MNVGSSTPQAAASRAGSAGAFCHGGDRGLRVVGKSERIATSIGRARNGTNRIAAGCVVDADGGVRRSVGGRPGRSERPVSDPDLPRRLHDRRRGLRPAGVRRPGRCRPGVLRLGADPDRGAATSSPSTSGSSPPVDVLRVSLRGAPDGRRRPRDRTARRRRRGVLPGNARPHRETLPRRRPRNSGRLRVSVGRPQVRPLGAPPPNTPPRPKARSGSRSRIADRSRASMRRAEQSSR